MRPQPGSDNLIVVIFYKHATSLRSYNAFDFQIMPYEQPSTGSGNTSTDSGKA